MNTIQCDKTNSNSTDINYKIRLYIITLFYNTEKVQQPITVHSRQLTNAKSQYQN